MGSCWVHGVLRLRRHPSKGDPLCFKTGKLTVHHQPFNKMTQSIFIILIQLSCFVSTNLNIFQNLFFFHLPDYSIKHFYVSFKSYNHMYKSTAIACGVHIFGIERQPCNSDTRGKQRIMSNSLYTASSSVSGSSHVVCSIGTVIPRCAPSAQPSITVHHQPFNKVTYQYSLSSYNYSALYQLNIFKNLFL